MANKQDGRKNNGGPGRGQGRHESEIKRTPFRKNLSEQEIMWTTAFIKKIQSENLDRCERVAVDKKDISPQWLVRKV